MYRRRILGETGHIIDIVNRKRQVSVRFPENVYKIVNSYTGKILLKV